MVHSRHNPSWSAVVATPVSRDLPSIVACGDRPEVNSAYDSSCIRYDVIPDVRHDTAQAARLSVARDKPTDNMRWFTEDVV